MTDPGERLCELMIVEPPASLDALVLARATSELENAHRPDAPRLHVPLPERWIYVAGVAAYGGQAIYGLARLLVRAISG